MNQIFTIDGKQYRRRHYLCSELAEKIIPSLYGTTVRDITYEQLTFMTNAMNDGWQIVPGYYGEKTENGTLLRANTSWFSFVGLKLNEFGNYDSWDLYRMCVNYNRFENGFPKNEIMLYDWQGHIGTFPTYWDMLSCTDNKFSKMIPCKITGYNNPFVLGNVEAFEDNGCRFDDIFNKNEKIYDRLDGNDLIGMNPCKLNVSIDYDRLVEVNNIENTDKILKEQVITNKHE